MGVNTCNNSSGFNENQAGLDPINLCCTNDISEQSGSTGIWILISQQLVPAQSPSAISQIIEREKSDDLTNEMGK